MLPSRPRTSSLWAHPWETRVEGLVVVLCSRRPPSPPPCCIRRGGICIGRRRNRLDLLAGETARQSVGWRLRMPNRRLWCNGMRLRGVVGGLRRIGLLRSWAGLAMIPCAVTRSGLTSRVVAQGSFRSWKPYRVVEGSVGCALVLLESCWIVFGSDDAALRAAAEPHISLTHVFNSHRTLLFAVLTSQVTSQSPLFFLFLRAALIHGCHVAAVRKKRSLSTPTR